MKIIILTPFMNGFGGTEKVIANFCDAFKEVNPTDVELKVIDIGGTDDLNWTANRPIRVVQMNKNRKIRTVEYVLTLIPRIRRILKAEQPDIVISTNPLMWSIAFELKHVLKKRVQIIAWYHYSLAKKPINDRYLRRADYYWAISSGIQTEFIDAGIPADRVQLIFNPVQPSTELVSRSPKHNRFVYMGRTLLDGQKNLRELLTTLAELPGDWQLDVYGDGEDRDRAPQLAETLGIAEHVTWHGFVSDAWQQIDQADALILTSTYEGFPMVLVEALSHGLYVISTDCPTGPADIIDGANGSLYTLGDNDGLLEILNGLVNGQLEMPDQSSLVQSVKRFYFDGYMKNVVQLLREMEN